MPRADRAVEGGVICLGHEHHPLGVLETHPAETAAAHAGSEFGLGSVDAESARSPGGHLVARQDEHM